MSSYKVKSPVSFLFYCGYLFGVCTDGNIIDVDSTKDNIKDVYR